MRKLSKFLRHSLFKRDYSMFDVIAFVFLCDFYSIKDWQFWVIGFGIGTVSAILTDLLINSKAAEDDNL